MIVKDLLRYDNEKMARILGISKNGIGYMQKLVERIFIPHRYVQGNNTIIKSGFHCH